MQPALYILLSIVGTLVACGIIAAVYVKTHVIGTFRFDNNGETPMCTFELSKLPENFEKQQFVIARVEWADLSLPGAHK